MKRGLFYSIFIVVLAITSSVFYHSFSAYQEILDAAVAMPEPAEETGAPAPPRLETITLIAAGDCLMHNTQIWAGQQSDGSYSFDSFFAPVQHLIKSGDYASVTFEAALAGPQSGYTGYPLFNSPDAMAAALKNAGFDLVNTANNHILDRGFQGALRTMDILRQAGLETVGTYSSAEAKEQFLVKTIRDVKVGYLAYSYSTNGIPVPSGHDYFYNYLDQDKILADIQNLRPQVDVLLLILHWGAEYSTRPASQQQETARLFLEAGADAILGSHPHVIQTMEVIKVDDRDKFVIYSLGNFIGDQNGVERNSGVLLKMKFTKDFQNNRAALEEINFIPTYVNKYYTGGKRAFQVIPVEESILSWERGEPLPNLSKDTIPVLRQVLNAARQQLGPDYYRSDS